MSLDEEHASRISSPTMDCGSKEIVVEDGLAAFKESSWLKLKTVTCLNLSECRITKLPESIGELSCLVDLEAARNQLSSLPSSFGQLKRLVRLVLPFNKLRDLPESFAALCALEVLDLSHNEMDSPPSCLEVGCPKIMHLDLSHNHLEDWKTPPLCAYALRVLNCSHNEIQNNPAWLWADLCQSLMDLNLGFNVFKNPASMVKKYASWRTGVSVSLKNLDLSNSGISSNDQLKSLCKLNVSCYKEKEGNKTTGFSNRGRSKSNFIWQLSFKPFLSKSVLTELHLCGVGLAFLPEDINCLQELDTLYCEGNELQWLPDSVTELSKLRVLSFSCNKLLYLPKCFGKLCSLQELRLNNNQLDEVPSSLDDLQGLKWLDLYNNNLLEIPPCIFVLFTRLSGLDLDYNLFDLQSEVTKANCDVHTFKILKKALCSHQQIEEVRRGEGSKPDSEKTDSLCGSTESYSMTEYSSVCSEESEDSQRERDDLEVQEKAENRESEEEWDLDEGQDDYFDPTCLPPKTLIQMPERALIVHEVVIGPDSFCPSDIHPSPAIRAKKDPFLPDEGQFDDA